MLPVLVFEFHFELLVRTFSIGRAKIQLEDGLRWKFSELSISLYLRISKKNSLMTIVIQTRQISGKQSQIEIKIKPSVSDPKQKFS